ncbi:MAG TPA: chemotaxis protein [Cyanobacteria bacterium UBA8803]|nr:chemotaxis protein [Cyanobacteria bacterium UBA9273]HBL60736.1 chemotaxis protein [Cyanobacteria bacterium UBA8803]
MNPEDLTAALLDPESSEGTLHHSSDVDPATSKTNGESIAAGFKSNPDAANEALALVTALKNDLEQVGDLGKAETYDKIVQLEKWAQTLPPGQKANSAITAEQQFKRQRQWLLSFTNQIRRASDVDLDALFATTVAEIRQYLQVDRALIYRFQTDTQGTVIAENLLSGYTPSMGETLNAIAFGAQDRLDYQQQQVVAIEHVYQKAPSAYQLQLMQRFQVKASLSIPIFLDGLVWGLLVVQQCSGISRRWQEAEVNLLLSAVTEVTLKLQPWQMRLNQLQQAQQHKTVGKVAAKILKNILRSGSIEHVFNNATREIRHYLMCDRVAVYRFNPDWSGDFVAESVGSDWVPLVGPNIKKVWTDTYLQDTQGGRYRNEETFAVNNIYTAGHQPCHIDLLEQFEAKAYAIAPIFEGEQLWGLLAAFQNSGPRQWDPLEVSMLALIGRQFGVALQQAEYLEKLQLRAEQVAQTAERERAVARTVEKIRQTADLETIFQTATKEVRKLLNVERVTIYKFREDYFGDFVYESESGGWPKLVGSGWEDPYLQENQGGRFRKNEPLVVDDIYHAALTDCHIEALENFGAKSCLVVSIFQGSQLWGLLSAFQHSGPRHWEETEVKLLAQVSTQLGVALQQAEYLKQIQLQTEQQALETERQRTLVRVLDKICQTLDIDKIFDTAAREVRRLLEVERVTIYKFRDDYFGDFIYESDTGGLPKLVGSGWEDSYLQEHQGGRFRNNEPLVVNDIYDGSLSECHVEVLESYGAKACLVVAISQQNKLWGLLSAFQNHGPRHWEEADIRVLTQVGNQLGVALQQADYFKQLQQKSNQIAKSADLDRATTRIIAQIRQSIDVNTIFQTTSREIRQVLKADRAMVYRLDPATNFNMGDVVAEDVLPGYAMALNAKITDHCFGAKHAENYRQGRVWSCPDIYEANLVACYVAILKQFDVRANLVVPLVKGTELWGLLCIHQCSGPRHWSETEIEFAKQVASQFGVALEQAEYLAQLETQSTQLSTIAQTQGAVSKILTKLSQFEDETTIYRMAALEVRQLIKCDRAAVYRFNPDWSGTFIAESVSTGWVPLVGPDIQTVWPDTYIQETQGGRYRNSETLVVDDIYTVGHSQCHVDILEQFEVKAYLTAPIFVADKLWGVLCAYQNNGPRHWNEAEITAVTQIGQGVGIALQRVDYLKQIQARSFEQTTIAQTQEFVSKILTKLNQLEDETSIHRMASMEVRQLFKCDRAAVYRFNPDWSGTFIAESVTTGWVPLVGPDIETVWPDTYLQETQGGRYRHRETLVVDDVYTIGHSQCHVDILEQFQVKAYLTAPIFVADKLWGVLCAYQNSAQRHWSETEITALTQISQGMGIALQRLDYIQQVQQQSAKFAKLAQRETNFINLLYKTGQRIAEHLQVGTLNPDSLVRATCQELRQLFKTDRVAVYHFNPDWSGEFAIEDISSSCTRLAGTESARVVDPVLQETMGGIYRKNESSAVSDISSAENLTFEKELLVQWGAKAYMIAPLFKGNQLWGLLTVYHNSEPRAWEEDELKLLVQMATQLGIALQQAESLEQIQKQSQQLAEAAQREKNAKEELQQGVMQLLSAVRPALLGDLTVRAPLTEDEVGTVADAYNNTLQSLRQIVKQVQESSRKVAQTSLQSDTAITSLTSQAQQQFQALSHALEQVQMMVNSTIAVERSAQQVEAAAQQANQTVREGDAAMNRTVEGILDIRETVAETSKRIKRLSESTQKVSKVVNLIGNFTTQTQLLALNASIEATRAGEYGRGFAVVADEVRSLARQSAEATREIEQLVQEIQQGTAEVATAMETGIEQVAQGTNLVTDTRQTLNAIVSATSKISELVEGITQATQLQTQEFQSVTQTMTNVAGIANTTSADSLSISTSFKELLAMAQNLQTSADRFKVD